MPQSTHHLKDRNFGFSGSSGLFTTSATSAVAVPGLSVTLELTGDSPVQLGLTGLTITGQSTLEVFGPITITDYKAVLTYQRGGVQVGLFSIGANFAAALGTSFMANSAPVAWDDPQTGSHTYTVEVAVNNPNATVRVQNFRLFVLQT